MTCNGCKTRLPQRIALQWLQLLAETVYVPGKWVKDESEVEQSGGR